MINISNIPNDCYKLTDQIKQRADTKLNQNLATGIKGLETLLEEVKNVKQAVLKIIFNIQKNNKNENSEKITGTEERQYSKNLGNLQEEISKKIKEQKCLRTRLAEQREKLSEAKN